MLYIVEYVRDGKKEQHHVSKVGAMALVNYLKRTFRIDATMRPAANMGGDR